MTSEDGYRSECIDREPTPADFGPEVEAEARWCREQAMLAIVGMTNLDDMTEITDTHLAHLRASVAHILIRAPKDAEAEWLWRAIVAEQKRREDERAQWDD